MVRYFLLFVIVNCFILMSLLTFTDVSYVIDRYFKFQTSNVSTKATTTITTAKVICEIPTVNPWDPVLLPHLEHPKNIHCSRIQPDLTFIDAKGYLRINDKELFLLKANKELGDFICHCTFFDRGATDRELVFDDPIEMNKNFSQPVEMKKKFAQISCFTSRENETSKLLYRNVHSYIPPGSHPFTSENQLSVVILSLESVSASMVHRHLPKTLNYLTKTMEATMFTGFNKVGENTLPNFVAMLTGLRGSSEDSNTMRAEVEKDNDNYYDHYPFIWKKYRAKNYSTTYVEDSTHLSTFHNNANGFKTSPVDNWCFPFWEAVRRAPLPGKSKRFCFGNKPNLNIFYDIVANHIKSYRQVPSFLFSLFGDLSHDHTNDIERADREIRNLLKMAFKSGYLDRTILLFMGDHGQRYSRIRPTVPGFIEERNPALFIWLPKWFLKKHRKISFSLKRNENRLISPFDIHETLLDVLNKNFVGKQRNMSSRGQSLLYPIRHKRTCKEAGIPSYYCLCGGLTGLNVNDDVIQTAAKSLVGAINNLTIIRDQHLCATYTLRRVIYAIRTLNYVVKGNDYKSEPLGAVVIAVEVSPKAKFEGSVLFMDMNMTQTSVDTSRFERIDPHFDKSNCVWMPQDKKICTCIR